MFQTLQMYLETKHRDYTSVVYAYFGHFKFENFYSMCMQSPLLTTSAHHHFRFRIKIITIVGRWKKVRKGGTFCCAWISRRERKLYKQRWKMNELNSTIAFYTPNLDHHQWLSSILAVCLWANAYVPVQIYFSTIWFTMTSSEMMRCVERQNAFRTFITHKIASSTILTT